MIDNFMRAAGLCLLATALPLSAATFTVTTNADSGPGSLRAAIVSANTTPGADRIEFAIGSGPQTIAPMSPLPSISDAVTIDATTQPGFSGQPIIELNGASAGAGLTSGFDVMGNHVTIQGFVINRFAAAGIVTSAADTRIYTNWIGLGLDGTTDLGNGIGVNCLGGCNFMQVGGTLAGQGNVISGNTGSGVRGAQTVSIRNNLIGTDVTGSVARPNEEGGITVIVPSPDAVVSGNVVGGNGRGIEVIGGSGATVSNNLVGVGSNGTTPIPNENQGLLLAGEATQVFGNTIANNELEGIGVVGLGTGNRIRQNRIYNNGTLGIDLNIDGVTPNDPMDADGDLGPNDLQNFPVIGSAITQGATSIAVQVTMASKPNTAYLIDFYGNAVCDREGQTFIGSRTVTTDATGSVTFNAVLTVAPGHGFTGITATATDTVTSDTSEFSACRALTPPSVISFTSTSPTVNEAAGTISVTVERTGDPATAATIDYTTTSGTATAGSDFTTTSGTLSWPAGDGSPRTIVVPILNDTEIEPDEFFTITLSNPTGATLGEASTATVTIVSEDAAAAAAPVPTASEWALLLLGATLAFLALRRL